MQPHSEGIPSTVALLSDELLLAGVLIRLALWRYAALAERRTCDNLSRCGQELHLTSGNQMPLVLAGCRGGSSSAQPSDHPGYREQKPSLTAPRPGLPVVHTQVASHTVSHTGAVREGFCSRHHCASSRTSWHRLHVYLHEDEGPSLMMLLQLGGDSFMCFCGNPSRERDRKGHHVLK